MAFETNFPEDFLDLVQQLRETEISMYTLQDTPIFSCVRVPAAEMLDRLGLANGGLSRKAADRRLAAMKTFSGPRIRLIRRGLRRFWRCCAKTYPGVVCALNHKNAWELTVATILSAQCTDVRVNLVTPALFKAFPTPKAMAAASLPELEELIRTTGFFRNKAKSIQGAARVVMEEFGGKVPQTMEEILGCRGWRGRRGMWCSGRGLGLRWEWL